MVLPFTITANSTDNEVLNYPQSNPSLTPAITFTLPLQAVVKADHFRFKMLLHSSESLYDLKSSLFSALSWLKSLDCHLLSFYFRLKPHCWRNQLNLISFILLPHLKSSAPPDALHLNSSSCLRHICYQHYPGSQLPRTTHPYWWVNVPPFHRLCGTTGHLYTCACISTHICSSFNYQDFLMTTL